MSLLPESWSKTEKAKHINTTRPTLDKWLIRFNQEKECKEKLNTFKILSEAIQSEFQMTPEKFIKRIKSDLFICSIEPIQCKEKLYKIKVNYLGDIYAIAVNILSIQMYI